MYCRMCGKKIGDEDHFCQFCGTPAGHAEPPAEPSEIKEEIIFNPPYEEKPHLTEEELKEFISENEIEEAQQEEAQKQEGTEEPEPDKNPEFAWNIYEFPAEKKKTEDVEFNWNMQEFGQPEQKGAKAAAFEEELFQEIRDDSSRIKEQNIDRFFTFSRKNEEFQELLDKEYEKFKMSTGPVTAAVEKPPSAEAAEEQPIAPAAGVSLAAGPSLAVDAAPTEPQVRVIKESGIPEAVTLQEIHIKPGVPEEEPVTELSGEDLFEAVPEAAVPEAEPEVEAAETEAKPETETAKTRAEHISEMEQARAQYFGEELIRDNESIRKRLAAGEPEAEHYTENSQETPGEAEASEEDADRRAESVTAAYAAAAALGETEEQTAVPPSDNLTVTTEDTGEKKEEEKHKRSAGQIVLAVIAVILAIEIAILGIRYFAPESGAARAIGNAQTEIFNTVSGWFGGDGGRTNENGSDEQKALPEDSEKTDQGNVEKEESPADAQTKAPADPNPMADKNALVASQMGNNKNIEQVKANEALAWKQGKNYGLSDINNSKPVTNNIWQAPETGDPVYYDKSVVGTVIAFDSQWIDYVNGSDKSVLSLLKKDSEAYRKSVNYTKVGKIKETFKLLEIGEIRQGANGFYIWVHEEIGATENGKTSDMKYNWIYYLEPEGGQMKIVNYYHF